MDQLVNMFQEKEIAEHEKFQLREEKHHYQQQLGEMVEKIGSQIEQLDCIQKHPCYPLELSHLLWGVPARMCNNWLWPPDCPCFRDPNPPPRDEGTYEQWKFQVNGMRSLCTEPAVRSALITSLRGEASELIGFVGFGAPLGAILEAMDKRFGKRSTTDRL